VSRQAIVHQNSKGDRGNNDDDNELTTMSFDDDNSMRTPLRGGARHGRPKGIYTVVQKKRANFGGL